MAEFNRLIQELNGRLRLVAEAAGRWERAIVADDCQTRPVLPLRDEVRQPISLQPLSSAAVPEIYRNRLEDEVRKRVQSHYWNVAVLTAGNNAGLLRTLSGIAHDAAAHRTLITAEDTFDVSGRSILTAAAMCNFMHLVVRWSKKKSEDGILEDQELKRDIVWPLRAADHHFGEWRPGDLWWTDLATRTVRSATEAVTHGFRDDESGEVLVPLLLEFVKRCTLGKVLEVSVLGRDVAKLAKYGSWPGLNTLVADSGAASLQNTLCTELVAQLAADQTGLQQVAFLQMLNVLAEPESTHEWSTRILVARLFWEMLEYDADLLTRLQRRGPASAALGKALGFLRDGLACSAPDDQQHLERRFRDIWASLSAYDEIERSSSGLTIGAIPPLGGPIG